jgi:hypothetical protein
MPLGANKAAIFGVSGVSGDNYFGDGGDSSLTTSGNLTYTVANKNGSYDGDMVLKEYSSLTVSAGHTITVDQPCRGLLIYVTGNCTVNGTISMQDKGPAANPTSSGGSDSAAVNASGLQLPMFTASGSTSLSAATFAGCGSAVVSAVANGPSSGSGTIFSIARDGAAGGASVGASGGNSTNGNAGTAGTTGAAAISTGGGGSGSGASDGGTAASGVGGKGSCFSGGSGGGGSYTANGSQPGGAGTDYGGAGGAGGATGSGGAGGGAGNPGGAGAAAQGTAGGTGTGGLIWLVVGGDLTFGTSGSLDVDSTKAGGVGLASGHNASGGGGSGAGAIMMLYKGTLTDNTSGTIQSVAVASTNYKGGLGGVGGFHSAQVS